MPARTTDKNLRLLTRGGRLLGLFLFAMLALSCRTGDALLVCADTYFDSAFLTDDARSQLAKAMTGLGVRFDLRSLDPNTDAQSFLEVLGKRNSEFVVLTPFLADLAAAAAPVYRDRRFIVLYGDQISPQENIQRIVTDRSSAFFDAGRFAARLARYVGETAPHGGRVIVVAYDGDDRRKRELTTFLDGFEQGAGGAALGGLGEPEVRRFSSLQDGRAAARLVRDSSEEFDVMAVFLSSMNAEALQAVAGTEGA